MRWLSGVFPLPLVMTFVTGSEELYDMDLILF
jgi:hypothetical protein